MDDKIDEQDSRFFRETRSLEEIARGRNDKSTRVRDQNVDPNQNNNANASTGVNNGFPNNTHPAAMFNNLNGNQQNSGFNNNINNNIGRQT